MILRLDRLPRTGSGWILIDIMLNIHHFLFLSPIPWFFGQDLSYTTRYLLQVFGRQHGDNESNESSNVCRNRQSSESHPASPEPYEHLAFSDACTTLWARYQLQNETRYAWNRSVRKCDTSGLCCVGAARSCEEP